MKSGQRFRRANPERSLGNLLSAVRAVTRTGSNWVETVALGWRLGTDFDRAKVNEGNQISGSRLGSQQWQTQATPGHCQSPPARLAAAGRDRDGVDLRAPGSTAVLPVTLLG